MNLVQLSNELEYLPKDKLAEMAQDPSSMYPPYLVLAEIQRRTQMEKMYAAAQPRPQTTVAEEVVNEFAMTNPNAGISSMTGSAPTDRFSPESKDIPAPVLMQTAASGGLTGYQNRGQTMIEQSLANPQERGFFGRTFDYIKENPGSAALNAASLGLVLVPGVGLVSAGVRGLQGINYLRKAKQAKDLLKKGAQATVTRPKIATRANTNQPLGEAAKSLGITDDVTNLGRQFSPLRAGTTATIGAAGLQGLNYSNSEDKTLSQMMPDRELTAEEKELLRLQNEAAMAETKPERKGLDDSALDLVGLGGLIMGARNVSELGKGISDFATAKQVARGDKAQQDYYAASAAKAQEEVANMPLDRVLTSIDSLTKQQKQFLDGGDMESATAIGLQLQLLNQRALELQGIDLKTQASMDKNLIASFGT